MGINNDHSSHIRSHGTSQLTSLKTQPEIRHFVELHGEEQIPQILKFAEQHHLKVLFLGKGSNVVFRDRVERTLVIKNCIPALFEEIGNDLYRVGGSMALGRFLRTCLEKRLSAPYFLSSVPGTIAGAVAMNAGRGRFYRKDIFQYVHSLETIGAEGSNHLFRQEIPVSFRTTPFSGFGQSFISRVTFRLPEQKISGNPIKRRLEDVRNRQDRTHPSCGSIFKKKNHLVCWFLKGRKRGTAQFSDLTSNWIVNNRGSSSEDVIHLIEDAKKLHRILGMEAVEEVVVVD